MPCSTVRHLLCESYLHTGHIAYDYSDFRTDKECKTGYILNNTLFQSIVV